MYFELSSEGIGPNPFDGFDLLFMAAVFPVVHILPLSPLPGRLCLVKVSSAVQPE